MEITHIKLENFCKFYGQNNIDADVSGNLEILGKNRVGKSTIKKAIQWILNCRDENGKEITGIRPHDEYGNDIGGVETIAEITFKIDATTKALKKVFRQKTNKKGEFTGNVTDYYVNDIPKKATDYQAFLDETFAPADKLQYCLNANALLSKSSAEQRILLEKTFGKHTSEDVCDKFAEFSELKPMFADGTVNELKERCSRTLNGTRGKSATKGLRQLADEFAPRIDELHKRKYNIDIAELELQKADIKRRLEENRVKQEDAKKLFDEKQKLADGIMDLQFKLGDLSRKANEENEKKKNSLQEQISKYNFEISKLYGKSIDVQGYVEMHTNNVADYEKHIERAREDWKAESERVFDDSSLFCTYCGQEYPQEKKEQLKAEFESHKAKILGDIKSKGERYKELIAQSKEQLEKYQAELPKLEMSKNELEEKIEEAKKELDSLPETIDVSNSQEYKSIQSEISKKEKSMQESNSFEEMRNALKEEERELNEQLKDCDIEFSKVSQNNDIDERIEKLKDEQMEVQQRIADQERLLDLLKQFDRKKNELLTEDVNKYLTHCKVQMFRPLINGDTEECCEFVVNGESYNRNLNHGDRILTEIDICRAFQEKAGIVLPIIADDIESLDGNRVPKMKNQLILMRRTDDEELKITNLL